MRYESWAAVERDVVHVDVDHPDKWWQVRHRGGGASVLPVVVLTSARFVFDHARHRDQTAKVARHGGRLGLHAWVTGYETGEVPGDLSLKGYAAYAPGLGFTLHADETGTERIVESGETFPAAVFPRPSLVGHRVYLYA